MNISDKTPFPNFIHLDMKGIIPSFNKMLEWLDFLSDAGYNGIVFEYEDRIPWKNWAETYRPGYELREWQRIWEKCQELKLEIVPLVQTHGHLEWLLKRDEYSKWRENGCLNEICPQNQEANKQILKWLDEVCEMHQVYSKYIHVGGDETWNLATCPECMKIAKSSKDGKLTVYINHLKPICERIISNGFIPMIWGDMFLQSPELVKKLPQGTVLVDWQYGESGHSEFTTIDSRIWGASAICCSYDTSGVLANLSERLNNISGWHNNKSSVNGLIHTTWGRSRSLLPLYGPWLGWLPGFVLGGNPQNWNQDILSKFVNKLDNAMTSTSIMLVDKTIDELACLTLPEKYHQQCVRWWILALQYHKIKNEFISRAVYFNQFNAVYNNIGIEDDYVNHARRGRNMIIEKLGQWRDDVKDFFEDNELFDCREFVASRYDALKNIFPSDWAKDIVKEQEPVSLR